ncbi:hypothetical protein P1J78_15550 [Psychromarinibacter sp. C21-152]|uniref:Uncharacterized protein n=1 Tax=Psychromarinibacter sediminicola TaxID=3033385 RepID=A0AAE3TAM8_9RHOB|nr:hypothetical protein [Psychromarinibacter sediminicola]MDF0602154.1 hypothetical protein [Psychromarinibacter sediminicola]
MNDLTRHFVAETASDKGICLVIEVPNELIDFTLVSVMVGDKTFSANDCHSDLTQYPCVRES